MFPYPPIKNQNKNFDVPVMSQSISISASSLPGLALCLRTSAVRPQEILYFNELRVMKLIENFKKNNFIQFYI
jgi:hypothetical protein